MPQQSDAVKQPGGECKTAKKQNLNLNYSKSPP